MHQRLFVLIPKSKAKSSIEARQFVCEWLIGEGFVARGGRFSSTGPADWFVIGGRWSGELTRALLDQKKLKKFRDKFEKKYGWWTGGKEKITEQQRLKQSKELFSNFFPKFKDIHPFWRYNYKETGYKDDAMVVTGKLFDRLELNELPKNEEGVIDTEEEDIEKKSVVGKKWIVVVDYHF